MEEWREIDGFGGRYEISDQGRLRNRQGAILDAFDKGSRYLKKKLYVGCDNGQVIRRWVYLHQAVANAFLDKPLLEGMEVNHKNGIRTDNKVENLEWVTRQRNVLHSFHVICNNPTRKLIESEVLEIRRLRKMGETYNNLADRFGVSKGAIYHISKRNTWKHI